MSNELKFHYSFLYNSSNIEMIHELCRYLCYIHRIEVGDDLILIRKSTNIKCKMGMNSITKKSLRPISVAGSLTQLSSFQYF